MHVVLLWTGKACKNSKNKVGEPSLMLSCDCRCEVAYLSSLNPKQCSVLLHQFYGQRDMANLTQT
jgi:hypothetical protein